jgi:hypothetical protein
MGRPQPIGASQKTCLFKKTILKAFGTKSLRFIALHISHGFDIVK